MTEIAGLVIAIALMRLAAPRDPILRAAIVAQALDLATFAIAWQEGAGERNPLSALALDLSFALFSPAAWIAVLAAGLGLIALKVALIGFLIRISPLLGRYRAVVLGVAVGVGAVGAISNVVAYANSAVTLPILALFLVVAIRWPATFGDAVGASARLVASASLAFGGVVALSYLPYDALPYVCGWPACPSATLLIPLAIASFVAAVLVLFMTARFVVRVKRSASATVPRTP